MSLSNAVSKKVSNVPGPRLFSRAAIGGLFLVSVVIGAASPAWASRGWTISSSPNLSSYNRLYGVSCVSSTMCMAVGYYVNGSSLAQTLVESWNGTEWTVSSSPNQGTDSSDLFGVSCVSATSCMAVGSYYSEGTNQTLIESWNGHDWTISSSPEPGTNNVLFGVSCASATSCVAVGNYDGQGHNQTLIESWKGHDWSVSSSPDQGGYLDGISCASANSCMAVGYHKENGYKQTLTESWNGTAWTIPSSPSPSATDNVLESISCASDMDCMTVGYYSHSEHGSAVAQTLVEFWNGTAWTISSSRDRGTNYNQFFGVSCVSAKSCKAVGSYQSRSGAFKPLIESWNGTDWTVSTSPSDTRDNYLWSASCVSSPKSCEAVGWDGTEKINKTLIESYGLFGSQRGPSSRSASSWVL